MHIRGVKADLRRVGNTKLDETILIFPVGVPHPFVFFLKGRVLLFLFSLLHHLNPSDQSSPIQILSSHRTTNCSMASPSDAPPVSFAPGLRAGCKKIPRPSGPHVRPSFVTTRGDEMQIAFSAMSCQISRHQKRSTAHPFFQKGWGTRVLSPHGELRKWYPLLVPLLQAEKSGESEAPPALEVQTMSLVPDLLAGLRDILIVVFLGYGLRLLNQQNELLKQEKALKQSEIDVHKATIERLKALQAPAIARDLEQMIQTANNYADKKRELEERVRALTRENAEAQSTAEMSNLVGIAAGSLETLAILTKTRDHALGRVILMGESPEDDFLLTNLNRNIQHVSETAELALRGQRPKLEAMKEWIAKAVEKHATAPVKSSG